MAAGKGIPHDLAQYVIEASAGYHNGFWDLVAHGATFKSTGRRRTKPGRAVIAAHRDELAGAEKLAGLHMALWRARRPSPVTDDLDRALAQWNELLPGQRLVFTWPSAHGSIAAGAVAAGAAPARRARPIAPRRPRDGRANPTLLRELALGLLEVAPLSTGGSRPIIGAGWRKSPARRRQPARRTELRWAAAFYWWRASRRAARRQTLIVVLICGTLGAVSLAALAGARRTESAYGRYLASINASTVNVNIPEGGAPGLRSSPRSAACRGIRSSADWLGLDANPVVHGHVDDSFVTDGLLGSVNGEYITQDRVTVLRGRLPDPDATDEIALTAGVAKLFGVGVGGRVTYQYEDAEEEEPVVDGYATYRVVGIVEQPPVLVDQFDQTQGALLPPGGGGGGDGPLQRHRRLLVGGDAVDQGGCRYPGPAGAADPPGHPTGPRYPFRPPPLDTIHGQVQQAIEPQAVALGVFGGLVALAMLALVGQGLAELLHRSAPQLEVLGALGMTRFETAVGGRDRWRRRRRGRDGPRRGRRGGPVTPRPRRTGAPVRPGARGQLRHHRAPRWRPRPYGGAGGAGGPAGLACRPPRQGRAGAPRPIRRRHTRRCPSACPPRPPSASAMPCNRRRVDNGAVSGPT